MRVGMRVTVRVAGSERESAATNSVSQDVDKREHDDGSLGTDRIGILRRRVWRGMGIAGAEGVVAARAAILLVTRSKRSSIGHTYPGGLMMSDWYCWKSASLGMARELLH